MIHILLSPYRISIAVLTVGILFTSSARVCASPRYRMTDLGAMGMKFAFRLNNLGQLTGKSPDGEPLLFDGTQMIQLKKYGQLEIDYTSINDAGQMTGSCTSTLADIKGRPFLEDHGTFTVLGDIVGYPFGGVAGINSYGQIAGSSFVAEGNLGHVGWVVSNGVKQDLGAFYPSWVSNYPHSINNSGWVVGDSLMDLDPGPREDLYSRAYLWRGDELRDLGTFGGHTSVAEHLNDAGVVVGFADYPDVPLKRRIFVYSVGRMIPIPPMRPDAEYFSTTGINNYGVVIGGAGRDFIWSGGVSIRFDASLVDFSGSNLDLVDQPSAINDRGQILATAVDSRTGFGGPVLLTPIPPQSPTRLVNVSVRAATRTGDETLIAGFVISGGTGRVLARTVGPQLLDYGVAGAASDPRFDVVRLGETRSIAENDNWSSGTDAAAVSDAAARVGAFSLTPGSKDAALLADLPTGTYTVLSKAATATGGGIVLSEIYDAATAEMSGHLVNASMRLWIGTGEAVGNVGFVLSGESPAKVLIRAVGPGLAAHGVSNVLADPQFFLYRDAKAPALGNQDWGTAHGCPLLAAKTAEVGAFPLADGSEDAAMLLQLEPGSYSLVVEGQDGGTGNCLVEIYLLND